MKATETFQKTISDYLKSRGENDSLFALTLKKPNKNIDDCINYIFETVKTSGCNGFADEEIFNMAVHYYDEDDIKVKGNVSGKVIVNHTIEKPKQKELPLGGRDTAKDAPKKPALKVVKPVSSKQTSLF
ncbi:PcfK-like family protein [Pedobacter nototheniae]|uniref:PcfK-like family protein n=1 Tax=Pedobacter nototheniae TaxID=2488994 RepID=UPI00103BD07C|nr:PcfK-like family protein [Pedobacter nototheniae]